MIASDDSQTIEAVAQWRVGTVPPTMYYIADFITAEEERSILEKIPPNRWISLSKRRLQAIPTQLTASNTLLASPLPDWLQSPVVERIESLGIFADAPHGINHCLVNEYLPGQGIMPHEDGPAYHPIVATVSLGGTIVLNLTTKPGGEPQKWRIVQEPRSLLVTTNAAYTDLLHGIADIEQDQDLNAETVANWSLLGQTSALRQGISPRATRTSLTLRDVLKVSKVGSRLFGKPK